MSDRAAQILQQIYALLEMGKLNEAFRLASEHMPFYIENPHFLRLLSGALGQLGFTPESERVLGFGESVVTHQRRFEEKNAAEAEAYDEKGYSHPYAISGTDDQWVHPVWDRRAELVGSRIPAGSRVLDLGCGAMLLERHLAEGCEYLPVDLGPRDERTVVCDFDRLEYPAAGDETVVTCLGVLPYLQHQEELLRHILGRGRPVFVTFKPSELIRGKVARGRLPDGLGLQRVQQIVESENYEASYRFVLGQGDEVLLEGRPRAA